jgi:hypothetical protein
MPKKPFKGSSQRMVFRSRDARKPSGGDQFLEQLVFSIGSACRAAGTCSAGSFENIAPDDARRELADRVMKQLEGSGFEVDEQPGHCARAPLRCRCAHSFRIVPSDRPSPSFNPSQRYAGSGPRLSHGAHH